MDWCVTCCCGRVWCGNLLRTVVERAVARVARRVHAGVRAQRTARHGEACTCSLSGRCMCVPVSKCTWGVRGIAVWEIRSTSVSPLCAVDQGKRVCTVRRAAAARARAVRLVIAIIHIATLRARNRRARRDFTIEVCSHQNSSLPLSCNSVSTSPTRMTAFLLRRRRQNTVQHVMT
jgi:hypothetical protein